MIAFVFVVLVVWALLVALVTWAGYHNRRSPTGAIIVISAIAGWTLIVATVVKLLIGP